MRNVYKRLTFTASFSFLPLPPTTLSSHFRPPQAQASSSSTSSSGGYSVLFLSDPCWYNCVLGRPPSGMRVNTATRLPKQHRARRAVCWRALLVRSVVLPSPFASCLSLAIRFLPRKIYSWSGYHRPSGVPSGITE
ncbi:hypothetical protein B0H15DRAFT_610926 [Mycena belliarum]|uniref:Uncharacterized protein n=1 Tax=Mycena belliarum TaxID=1033014 RepID=A0AAD6XFJ2_9AGAR|nr:hypothetical protein B0H15DRAFT_610926 [Mycena belliae]